MRIEALSTLLVAVSVNCKTNIGKIAICAFKIDTSLEIHSSNAFRESYIYAKKIIIIEKLGNKI